jgi:hypothetical protein
MLKSQLSLCQKRWFPFPIPKKIAGNYRIYKWRRSSQVKPMDETDAR